MLHDASIRLKVHILTHTQIPTDKTRVLDNKSVIMMWRCLFACFCSSDCCEFVCPSIWKHVFSYLIFNMSIRVFDYLLWARDVVARRYTYHHRKVLLLKANLNRSMSMAGMERDWNFKHHDLPITPKNGRIFVMFRKTLIFIKLK